MWTSRDAYPEMLIARTQEEIRELVRQQRNERAREARRRHRLTRLLGWGVD